MERICGNAYAAVAATFSGNCEEGFLTKTERILIPFQTHSGSTHAFAIYPPGYLINDAHQMSDSSWAQRGWMFQERISSTSILMLSKGNIHLKCKYFNESTGGYKVTHEEYFIMLDRVTIDSGSTAASYQEWREIIAQIHPGRHELTWKSDFLPSIAGIASLFSKRLNDEYAAGLWKNSMHQSLCWAAGQGDKPSHQDLLQRLRNLSPYIAPSWSWASRREDFRFLLSRLDLSASCRPEFHSLDTDIALHGESAFGEVTHAALDITSNDTVGFDGRYFADIEPDCFAPSFFAQTGGFSLQTPISFLLIGSTIPRETDTGVISLWYSKSSETVGDEGNAALVSELPNTPSTSAGSGAGLETETESKRVAYGLLIHPTGNSNEYYRVGTFFSKPHSAGGLSFFDDVEVPIQCQYSFDPIMNETLKNEDKKMVHDIPGAEHASPQRGPPKATPSKKPSEYVFDSNGDTRIILSTYMAQTFEWEADKLRIKQEMPTKVYYKKKKQEKKEGKRAESLITTSTSLEGTTNRTPFDWGTVDFSAFSNVQYSRVELSDDEVTDLGCTGPETNRESTSVQIQDWNYGEKCARSLKKIDFRLLVSRKHLELASSVFKNMLTGSFPEGKADPSGFRLIKTSDWDPEALKIILTIMHGYNRDVPRSLSLEMLVKVAMIIDYYDCLESVEPYTDIWLEGLRPELPKVYGRDCILFLFISWVFSEPIMFEKMTELALRHSQKLVEAEDFPLPAEILERIDIARQSALAETFSALYELLDRLQEEQECSFECSSMLLGVLTKELSKHGILHPRSTPPFDGFSIEGFKEIIADLKKPQWYNSPKQTIHISGKGGKQSACLESTGLSGQEDLYL
ncbi:hypothetical protein FCOIX_7081 [Fusarium coicis]|nr:hypothetical protein FCOIX_7081 [Fusarium coicis]